MKPSASRRENLQQWLPIAASLALLVLTPTGLRPQDRPPPGATAKSGGTLVGRIRDAQRNLPLPGAEIRIPELRRSTFSAADGTFVISGIDTSPITAVVRVIGYRPASLSGIAISPGDTAKLDIELTPQVFLLEGIEVKSTPIERGTIAYALREQTASVSVINAISAEEMGRSPDSNAGEAVKRISGMALKDGRYLIARGLGERFSLATLNGLRIPSAEPEERVVPLDLFPNRLLESLQAVKTFTPDQPGELAAGRLDILTQELPPATQFTLSGSLGLNQEATFRTIPRAPTTGGEWFAFATAKRGIPQELAAAGTLAGVDLARQHQLIRSLRNSWSAEYARGEPNRSVALAISGQHRLLSWPGTYLGSLSYSYSQGIRAHETRAIASPSTTPGQVEEQNPQRGTSSKTSVLWGALYSLTARATPTDKLALTLLYTRSGENQATRIAGYNEGFDQYLDLTRLTYTERALAALQLSGEHLTGRGSTVEWRGGVSRVDQDEPDRSDLAYTARPNPASQTPQPIAWFGSPRSATRTFSSVTETAREAQLAYRLPLSSYSTGPAMKLGAYARSTSRGADSRAYDILNRALSTEERSVIPAESLFTDKYLSRTPFVLFANANGGRYDARERLLATFAQLEASLGTWYLIAGARVESWKLSVASKTVTLGDTLAALQTIDVLPALNARISLGENQNLKIAVSQTVNRPEYRELSPVTYFDILGGERLFGNPGLKRGLVQNLDLRWEWFAEPDYLLSVTLFGKRFLTPVERVLVQTSDGNSPDATFVNAHWARALGVEIEVRARADLIHPQLAPLSAFFNLTLMSSRIRPGGEGIASLTNQERPMVGQSPYVLSAGLSYSENGSPLGATVLYHVSGKRIHAAGIFPLPDTYELPRPELDTSVHISLGRRLRLKLDAKNLLDSPYRLLQGSVTRQSYRSGRSYSLGASWSLRGPQKSP
ncbi:hypothetical protein HRbin33_00869 [bacterium HR33]|nr:hypothetical protein HRbin33_00869 [bacterium HR33]